MLQDEYYNCKNLLLYFWFYSLECCFAISFLIICVGDIDRYTDTYRVMQNKVDHFISSPAEYTV